MYYIYHQFLQYLILSVQILISYIEVEYFHSVGERYLKVICESDKAIM